MKRIIFCLIIGLYCNLNFAQDFVTQNIIDSENRTSESYTSMTFNGSWCWFSDPRAVYYKGKHERTYTGWIDNYGDIHVAYYDHITKEIQSKTLYDQLEIDDHDNPSILIDEDGKLMVFFNKHSGVDPLYLVKALEPESINSWGEVKILALNKGSKENPKLYGHHTYTYPIKLSGENGRIYLFWRGIDGKPSYSFSDDNGDSWAEGQVYFMPEVIYKFRRPYIKIYSNGMDKIHFSLTDGHPRNEDANSIYYMYYKSGSFFKADGTKIKNIEDLPIVPKEADLVYNGGLGNGKAWNWDIGENEQGNPVLAYTRYPNDTTHIYAYATWENNKWNNFSLINSGSWFPKTMEGKIELEQNYSGGMSIDHEEENTLYLSINRDSVFEIEKWISKDKGLSWEISQLTKGSSKDNIRPFAIRGAKSANSLQVLWMQNTKYHHYGNAYGLAEMGPLFNERFHSSIKTNIISPPKMNLLQESGIKSIMRQIGDWQLANPFENAHRLNWHYGALYTGIVALYEVTGDSKYKDELYNIGQAYSWQPLNEIYHADRLAVMDTWAWLFGEFHDLQLIDKSRWVMDMHLSRNYKKMTDVRYKDNRYSAEWWSWCDALFMAPPSFVRMWKMTGDKRYLDYMDEQWWKTSNYLYSNADSLYYRDDRYFETRSERGTKVFWGRGNGWVIAGLARILTLLPQDYPNRKKFEKQYSEMAHKLLSVQGEDGLWRVSLLDPEFINIGESSGSAFAIFALAWGVNNGLIDIKFKPKIEKAWLALCGNVNEEGRLGNVQQVAGDPYPFQEDQWQVYATGAILLAGREMISLSNIK